LKTNIPTEKDAEAYSNELLKSGKEGFVEDSAFVNVIFDLCSKIYSIGEIVL
jgi:hypothetical protein